ncbi:SpoVT / AbrB-like protein, partial [Thermoplasmatales archaeon SCGC AB-539-N05]
DFGIGFLQDYHRNYHMEKRKRKLVRNGPTSLAVTLPKPWLDYYGLKCGDRVEMITNKDVTIKLLHATVVAEVELPENAIPADKLKSLVGKPILEDIEKRGKDGS